MSNLELETTAGKVVANTRTNTVDTGVRGQLWPAQARELAAALTKAADHVDPPGSSRATLERMANWSACPCGGDRIPMMVCKRCGGGAGERK